MPFYAVPPSEEFASHSTARWEQVQRINNAMSTNKAPRIDKVPIRVMKDSLSAILPSITSIFNATFQSSMFPSCRKIAEVTPILKDGDQEIPKNNRPISLLPVLSKVCKRAAHDQLVSYLSTKQRLTTQQCGNIKLEFYRNRFDSNYRFYSSKHQQERINCRSVIRHEQSIRQH